ncbi:MAG: 30S ribosomal protein S4 [Patescibacteria group bacterium]|mgnify:CR=1 FL=1
MVFRPTEKKERALGVKLLLKASRCASPKCAMIRRPFKPGIHGNKKGGRRKESSEFGKQLQEKQKVQFSYGLNNNQMRRLFRSKNQTEAILELLEKRLDNVIFRLGLADSRVIARQLINHGHFFVNDRKMAVPSYLVRIGDKISLNANSRKLKIFENLESKLKKNETLNWLKLDKEKLIGELIDKPQEINLPFDLNLVAEYYSR